MGAAADRARAGWAWLFLPGSCPASLSLQDGVCRPGARMDRASREGRKEGLDQTLKASPWGSEDRKGLLKGG